VQSTLTKFEEAVEDVSEGAKQNAELNSGVILKAGGQEKEMTIEDGMELTGGYEGTDKEDKMQKDIQTNIN